MADPKLVDKYHTQLKKQGLYPPDVMADKARKLAEAHERREKRKANIDGNR